MKRRKQAKKVSKKAAKPVFSTHKVDVKITAKEESDAWKAAIPQVTKFMRGSLSEMLLERQNTATHAWQSVKDNDQHLAHMDKFYKRMATEAMDELKDSGLLPNFHYAIAGAPTFIEEKTGMDQKWSCSASWGAPTGLRMEIGMQLDASNRMRFVVHDIANSREWWADSVEDFRKLLVWTAAPVPKGYEAQGEKKV